ncbi:hypothetical protein [Streptomyces paromomycinus]|uniref:3-hydroxyanthranilate 3,4-dioxygenase n=1 Tax=Streptomyces paromomycinus TaxID=92743 RepID=A0A401VWT2_STREY|nr:hypothetical protein [Streptomyces paromomycinus]GCD41518.1 3-hydroxyanthranilate 3,4-dioxygenase [Streptomyces paromomycinus]
MAKRPEPMYGRPFYFQRWLDGHRGLLEPPVGNAQLQEESGLMVTVVGGPDQRTDFHDDPIEEFFHQIRGSMVLRIMEEEGRPPRGVRFYGGDRRCPHCGAVHPGRERPAGLRPRTRAAT